MEPSLLIFFMIVVGIPVIGGIGMGAFQRWLQHKEKMSQLIANETAEKAAQYARARRAIEERVRVLEQIVTDGGCPDPGADRSASPAAPAARTRQRR